VFLKGCPLQCRWCQNPEGKSYSRDLFFNAETCIAGCHLCDYTFPEQVAKHDDKVTICRPLLTDTIIEQLEEICPSKAMTACGDAPSVENLNEFILRDLPFYKRSGGGITLSGGEPFAQPEFAFALLKAAREAGIHTAVETCLYVPWKVLSDSLPLVDLYLVDLKHVDRDKFRLWTGGNGDAPLENFRKLAANRVPMIARVPVIPNFNADETSLTQILDFISDCGHVEEVHLLPYHTLGKNKYVQLGKAFECSDTPLPRDSEILQFAQEYADSKGIRTTIGG
jgi:pyruvate formate lyase activating enzyme